MNNLENIKLGDIIVKGNYPPLTVEYLQNGLLYACTRDKNGNVAFGLSQGVMPIKILNDIGWEIKQKK